MTLQTDLSLRAPDRPEWLNDDLGHVFGAGVRVAVIDSGWDQNIYNPYVKTGVSFVDPNNELKLADSADFHDRNGHGTACIDIIQQHAPLCEIYPVRVFGRMLESSVNLICAGIQWAVENKMHIINLSLGTQRPDALRPLYIACEIARRNGVIVVAATHQHAQYSFPAVFENVYGVAQLDSPDPFAFDFDPEQAIEFKTTGSHAVVWQGGVTRDVAGTSFAAPVITALSALWISANQRVDFANLTAFFQKHSR